MMLVDLLAEDLLHWMDAAPDGAPRRVLLWLDPKREFRRLAHHLEPVIRTRGGKFLYYQSAESVSQLHLKPTLLHVQAQPEKRAIVYLPGFDRHAVVF